jgi:hypothetical protein
VDHWVDSPESRCVAGRAHWAEITCGHATTTKGRSCSFPTIARLSSPPCGAYEVTKQLPHNGREFEYRIKSANEDHERVARESGIGAARIAPARELAGGR